MNLVLGLLLGAIVVALVVVAVLVLRNASASSPSPAEAPRQDRLRPALADFHVRDDAAHVYFAVPLPPEGPGDHLRAVLEHEAIEVLKEKKAHGLPIADLSAVVAYGRRGDEAVEVVRSELTRGAPLPEIVVPELVPHSHATGADPLAHLGEQEFAFQPGVADIKPEAGLPPLSEAIELTPATETALRTQGIDPATAGLRDLVLGLLQTGGYAVSVVRSGTGSSTGDLYQVSRAGSSNLVAIVEHSAGDHPELPERAINEMIVAASERRSSGFLVTDKYGPYLMYEKEKRSSVRFITRERLQAFVDSFALQ